jgi:hypothetical protein
MLCVTRHAAAKPECGFVCRQHRTRKIENSHDRNCTGQLGLCDGTIMIIDLTSYKMSNALFNTFKLQLNSGGFIGRKHKGMCHHIEVCYNKISNSDFCSPEQCKD